MKEEQAAKIADAILSAAFNGTATRIALMLADPSDRHNTKKETNLGGLSRSALISVITNLDING